MQTVASVKEGAFDAWSESELKSYLESYGVVRVSTLPADTPSLLVWNDAILTGHQPVPQGSTIDSLRAEARKQFTYWKYGTRTPGETLVAKLSESFWNTFDWFSGQVNKGAQAAQEAAKNLRQEL